MSTNKNEASEYIDSFLTLNFFITLIIAASVCAFIALVCGKLTRKYRVGKIVFVAITLLLSVNIADIYRVGFDIWRSNIETAFSLSRTVNNVIYSYENVTDYMEYENGAKNNSTIITKDNSNIPNVVFIIGESTSRNHMSLYGYELDTTPQLKAKLKDGNLFVYKDVISHHSHTIKVMRELFTFYRRDSVDDWYKYVNLFDILAKTNYHTYWISNQEPVGVWSLDKFYSRRCDYKFFTEVRESRDDTTHFDGELIDTIKNLDFHDKNFLAIHLMGTHGGYKNRYPTEFEKFTVSDETKGENEKQKQERAFYDNAVLYNDYVVNSIIDMFVDKDAIVIYASDHADEVYEDRDFVGHSETDGSTHMIEIPMLIWVSESFKENRPELAARIAASVNRPFETDDMIHVLLDIMSIETPEYDAEKSVINDAYDSDTERTYGDLVYQLNGDKFTLREK